MNEMVTIPRTEYEALMAAREDLADLRAFDRAMASLDAGEDELIPAAFANRLIDGQSPVRVYREMRGMTQTALAEASGVNRVQIVNIEAGKGVGSVETLKRLGGALRVAVDDLI